MKKLSYPYLISATVGTLALIFIVITWKNEINQVVFIYNKVINYIAIFSLVVASTTLLLLINRIKSRMKTKGELIKAYLSVFSCAFLIYYFFSYIVVTTMAFMLPGDNSRYVTEYQYQERSGRGSCSGAELYDPEIGKIKVCYPAGAYSTDSHIYIEKRNNGLGFVVSYARTFS